MLSTPEHETVVEKETVPEPRLWNRNCCKVGPIIGQETTSAKEKVKVLRSERGGEAACSAALTELAGDIAE